MASAMYVVQMEVGAASGRLPHILLEILQHQQPSVSEKDCSPSKCCVLGSRSIHPDAVPVTEFFIQTWRHFHLHGNERQVVLGAEDQLIVVQLCLAAINKQKLGDFDVETSKVLEMHKSLCQEKLSRFVNHNSVSTVSQTAEFTELREAYNNFLTSCNTIDTIDVLSAIKTEYFQNEQLRSQVSGNIFTLISKPQGIVETSMLQFLSDQAGGVEVCQVGEPLTADRDSIPVDLKTEFISSSLDEAIKLLEDVPRSSSSVTEAYIEGVVVSYLVLLVNSRSEIALARTFNVPDRELDHKAFNSLKKAAQEKGLSMYQTASSFILRLRLGGKSYAPNSASPLSAYVKGLGEFVNLVHKLQTNIEECTNTSNALHRVINNVKNAILKHRDNVFRRESVEAVIERLHQRADAVIQLLADSKYESPSRDISSGGSVWGRDAMRVLRYLVDVQAGVSAPARSVDVLSDAMSSQRTPLRFTCLLSQFRSPVEASPESKLNQSLADRLLSKRETKQKKAAVPRFQANYDWAMPLHDTGLPNSDNYTMTDFIPSKTVVHSAPVCKPRGPRRVLESLQDQENALFDSTSSETVGESSNQTRSDKSTVGGKKGDKRSAGQENLSQPPQKKSKPAPKPARTSKKKTLPLQRGQKQLTSFFRV